VAACVGSRTHNLPHLGSGRLTADREGYGCPSGGVRSPAMAKKYREVREALIDAGWQVVRQRGSHEVWGHP
jgi:HicA-like toxin of HicAB toxin-antitoxin system